ncbi:MAG: type III-B CRISPR module-associated protein Cmr3, partial [Verrucomicrobiae bacterium]|nr:type III-B CRISPR module-associated protein Cmr3 [Verrucomicrobiae bacterium]
QQRLCTAQRFDAPTPLPLPKGLTSGFPSANIDGQTQWLVKWVLLTPAIWPEIEAGVSKRGTTRKYHPGGWLPNWVCPETGQVLLEAVDEKKRRERRSLNYDGKGYESKPNVSARLVAAIVPKPVVVTGWGMPNPETDSQAGAKSTHLAVPAGAVYFFEADSEQDAQRLAAVLNWHGDGPGSEIKNRRSTLLGEKGYGLGVCGKWDFHTPNTTRYDAGQ